MRKRADRYAMDDFRWYQYWVVVGHYRDGCRCEGCQRVRQYAQEMQLSPGDEVEQAKFWTGERLVRLAKTEYHLELD